MPRLPSSWIPHTGHDAPWNWYGIAFGQVGSPVLTVLNPRYLCTAHWQCGTLKGPCYWLPSHTESSTAWGQPLWRAWALCQAKPGQLHRQHSLVLSSLTQPNHLAAVAAAPSELWEHRMGHWHTALLLWAGAWSQLCKDRLTRLNNSLFSTLCRVTECMLLLYFPSQPPTPNTGCLGLCKSTAWRWFLVLLLIFI